MEYESGSSPPRDFQVEKSTVEFGQHHVRLTVYKALIGKTIIGWGFAPSPLIVTFDHSRIRFTFPNGRRVSLSLSDRIKPIRDIVVNLDCPPFYIAFRPSFTVPGLPNSYDPDSIKPAINALHDHRYITLILDNGIYDVRNALEMISPKLRQVVRNVDPLSTPLYDPFHPRKLHQRIAKPQSSKRSSSQPFRSTSHKRRRRLSNADDSDSNMHDIADSNHFPTSSMEPPLKFESPRRSNIGRYAAELSQSSKSVEGSFRVHHDTSTSETESDNSPITTSGTWHRVISRNTSEATAELNGTVLEQDVSHQQLDSLPIPVDSASEEYDQQHDDGDSEQNMSEIDAQRCRSSSTEGAPADHQIINETAQSGDEAEPAVGEDAAVPPGNEPDMVIETTSSPPPDQSFVNNASLHDDDGSASRHDLAQSSPSIATRTASLGRVIQPQSSNAGASMSPEPVLEEGEVLEEPKPSRIARKSITPTSIPVSPGESSSSSDDESIVIESDGDVVDSIAVSNPNPVRILRVGSTVFFHCPGRVLGYAKNRTRGRIVEIYDHKTRTRTGNCLLLHSGDVLKGSDFVKLVKTRDVMLPVKDYTLLA